MKGNILDNMTVSVRRSRSELSSQSIQSSLTRTKTGISNQNFDTPRQCMLPKRSRAYRKLNNSTPGCRVNFIEKDEILSIEKSENRDTEQSRPSQPQARTSVVWLQKLYALWEPQLCESYRPGAHSPLPSEEEEEEVQTKNSKRRKSNKKNSMDITQRIPSATGKFKTMENVAEAVRHFKMGRKTPKTSFARHSSVGLIVAGTVGGKQNSNYLKRSLSQLTTM